MTEGPNEQLYTGAPEGQGERQQLRPRVDGKEVALEWSAVGLVNADTVKLQKAGAGAVLARGNVTIEQGGARTLVTTGPLQITQGGAAMILAGGGATVSQGGAGTFVVFGDARIEQGGALVLLTPSATLGQGARVGLAISPRLEIGEGAQVLAGPRQIALGALAATGLALLVTLLVGLLRR